MSRPRWQCVGFGSLILFACTESSRVPVTSPDEAAAMSPEDRKLRAAVDDAFEFAAARSRETIEFVKTSFPADYLTYYPTNTFTSGPDLGKWNFVPRTSPTVGSRVTDWRSGFFPGSLWLLHYENGAEDLKTYARNWTEGIAALQNTPLDHDIGMRFLRSFGDGLRVTRSADDPDGSYRAHARDMLLAAAATLDTRFDRGGIPVGAIRGLDDWPVGPYTIYVDSMMNVGLLFEAWELSGCPRTGAARQWYEHGITHSATIIANHIRADGSTYHLTRYNDGTFGTPSDGRLYDKITDQGFGGESTWSRGQAWAIYGFTAVYAYTRRDPQAQPRRFLEAAQKTADYFLAHLPANDKADRFNYRKDDFVPPSDFDAALGEPAGPYNDANGDRVFGDRRPAVNAFTERDSSAAAVAASALFELSKVADGQQRRVRYRKAATDILRSLLTFRDASGKLLYLAKDSPHRGLLANGSSAWGGPTGTHIFGDYFLLEAMIRYRTGCLMGQRDGACAEDSDRVDDRVDQGANTCGRTLD